jgi:hypothetical protein
MAPKNKITEPQQCRNPDCNKTIHGRYEKRFCNEACRYAYHNILKTEETRLTAMITNTLKKNRRILLKLLQDKQVTAVPEKKLADKGFHFLYHTHLYHSKKSDKEYIFCFDYGYRILEDGYYQIVRSF